MKRPSRTRQCQLGDVDEIPHESCKGIRAGEGQSLCHFTTVLGINRKTGNLRELETYATLLTESLTMILFKELA